MGAPKQKWTAEEEAALKAGVGKHGAGKWRTILTDPEFSSILRLRSNVDLKDKWRNINVMISGLGSRSRSRLGVRKTPKHRENHQLALSTVLRSGEEVVDAKPLAVSIGTILSAGSKESIARFDKVILSSIRKLNEPGGSDKAAIAKYIEEQCHTEPEFKKYLAAKLKHLTANGKLIKIKHKYRIAKRLTSSEVRRGELDSRAVNGETNKCTRSQIDEELSKLRSMTPQEAAAAAAQAVAEAEAAMAEAAEAAREAEAAEAEAEAAEIFAQAAMKALKCTTLGTW